MTASRLGLPLPLLADLPSARGAQAGGYPSLVGDRQLEAEGCMIGDPGAVTCRGARALMDAPGEPGPPSIGQHFVHGRVNFRCKEHAGKAVAALAPARRRRDGHEKRAWFSTCMRRRRYGEGST